MSLGYKVQLGFGLFFLWIVAGFFLGIPWAIILGLLGGKNLALVEAGHALGGFFAWTGMMQGIIGGIYHFGMIFRRGVAMTWSQSQSIRDGFVISIPATALMISWSDVRWTILGLLFFPLAAIISSHFATYVVNHDITSEMTQR